MEYQTEVVIEKDRMTVWRAFDDREKRRLWQPALTEIVRVQGEPGRPGSVSQFVYGSDVVEESVLVRQPPQTFSARYHSSQSVQDVQNRFSDAGMGHTRWTMSVDVSFHTIARRIMGFMVKRSLVSDSQEMMQSFKKFVEGGG